MTVKGLTSTYNTSYILGSFIDVNFVNSLVIQICLILYFTEFSIISTHSNEFILCCMTASGGIKIDKS